MLASRIIPVLLVHNKGLVKTTKFKNAKYVGDPLNAVKIFNEKEADELMVLDIDATVEKRGPDLKMISNLANECRMPLCYGGGIKTIKEAVAILALGVEKVALSSVLFEDINIVSDLASQVGSQSVVAVLDIKKKFLGNKFECYTHNSKQSTGIEPISFAKQLEESGVGEIVINSIDNDGMMKGYAYDLIHSIKEVLNVPVTALGGAGSDEHIKTLIQKEKLIGAAVGSYFVFKGKYKAVLINYPNYGRKQEMLGL